MHPPAAFGPLFALSWPRALLHSMKPYGKNDVWSQNTPPRVSWPLFWAGCPRGVLLSPTAGSCCASSPCPDPVIWSFSSQQGHHPTGTLYPKPSKCCGSCPEHLAPFWQAWGDGAELCCPSPLLEGTSPLAQTCPSHPWEHWGFAAAGSGTGGPCLWGRRAPTAPLRWQNYPK